MAAALTSFIDPSLQWEDVAWFRGITDMPLVLKGVQCGEDAVLAYRAGCKGHPPFCSLSAPLGEGASAASQHHSMSPNVRSGKKSSHQLYMYMYIMYIYMLVGAAGVPTGQDRHTHSCLCLSPSTIPDHVLSSCPFAPSLPAYLRLHLLVRTSVGIVLSNHGGRQLDYARSGIGKYPICVCRHLYSSVCRCKPMYPSADSCIQVSAGVSLCIYTFFVQKFYRRS